MSSTPCIWGCGYVVDLAPDYLGRRLTALRAHYFAVHHSPPTKANRRRAHRRRA